jgi:Zn-dependent alcohol dehydrogenase
MQAKAAVLYEAGTPLRLEEVEVLPPQRGEVQVRMYAGGVCHSDLHVMKGDLVMPMPIILGHEGSGIVECVGEGVTSVQPGDHVIPIWRVSCGSCEYCTGGRPALCDVGTQMRVTGLMPDGTTRFRVNNTPTLIGSRALAAYGDADGPSAANNRLESRRCTARPLRRSEARASVHGCGGTRSVRLGGAGSVG